jgi:hypothetical protein
VPSTGQAPKRAPPPDPESALLDDLAAYSTAACAYAAVAMASPESDRRTKRVRTVFGIPSNRENSNTGLVRRVGCVDGPGGDGVPFDGCYEGRRSHILSRNTYRDLRSPSLVGAPGRCLFRRRRSNEDYVPSGRSEKFCRATARLHSRLGKFFRNEGVCYEGRRPQIRFCT